MCVWEGDVFRREKALEWASSAQQAETQKMMNVRALLLRVLVPNRCFSGAKRATWRIMATLCVSATPFASSLKWGRFGKSYSEDSVALTSSHCDLS